MSVIQWRCHPNKLTRIYRGFSDCVNSMGLKLPPGLENEQGYCDFLEWCRTPEIFETYVLCFLKKRGRYLKEWISRRDIQMMFYRIANDLRDYHAYNAYIAKMLNAVYQFQTFRWMADEESEESHTTTTTKKNIWEQEIESARYRSVD